MSFLLWYLLITLLGLLTFPLAYKLLPALADRGYALARTLGLLLWGYLFWILGVFHILPNSVGGELAALGMLAALGFWAWRSLEPGELRRWVRRQRRMILIVEVLFLLAFAGWAVVRAANPDIAGTEKPMELAFINAILHSPSLPPHDPWLSGYSISYYYFGYVLVAMLARLTASPGSAAFNLGLALIFALGAVGSYGVLYNLLGRKQKPENSRHSPPAVRSPLPALLAPFFVLIVSNLSGLLQWMYARGIFWQQTGSGGWVSPFWAWLDIGRFANPPTGEALPFWWWWQGSRIVQDYDYLWVNKGDVIDEFPFFSFLLGDLHPHVLALPFAFLVMAAAYHVLLGGGEGRIRWLGIPLRLNWTAFGFSALVLGAMGFLNTWDFPFYVALFAGAYALRGWWAAVSPQSSRRTEAQPQPRRNPLKQAALDFLGIGLALGVTGGVLYLPFYLSFSSQAGGFLPNLIYITKGAYTWIQFAPLLVPIFGLLFYLARRYADKPRLLTGLKAALVVFALLFAATALFTALIAILPAFAGIKPEAALAADAYLGSLQAPGWGAAIIEGFRRRAVTPGTWLTLGAMLTLALAVLIPDSRQQSRRAEAEPAEAAVETPSRATLFVLLAVTLAALLVLTPEFFFLRDFFGYRINTIFKFYYIAWLLWAIAAAYATATLWNRLRGGWGWAFRGVTLAVLALSMLYPAMGLWSKTNGFNPPQWTLDGAAFIARSSPDEAAAARWLASAPLGVVAEAASPASSYTAYARMATLSGQPAVLGWMGHESQWRGGYAEMGSREPDLAALYCSPNWADAQEIITRYGIRYIVVGGLERSTYARGGANCPAGLSEGKFYENLPIVFRQGDVTIFGVR